MGNTKHLKHILDISIFYQFSLALISLIFRFSKFSLFLVSPDFLDRFGYFLAGISS